MSIRLGKRINILYPITLQLQTGPQFYNFYTTRESIDNADTSYISTERNGLGLFENRKHNRVIAGWDFRSRLMIFDPAGTAGGLGFYFEYSQQYTFGKRSLNSSYQKFLGTTETEPEKWWYGAITIGLVAPLALRIVNFQ